jgi:hypothetical protein
LKNERLKGGNEVSVSGAMPHGRVDNVLSPKKPVLALLTSNQEPTLSGEITHSPLGEHVVGCRILRSPLANCVIPLPLVAPLPPSIHLLFSIPS